LARHSVGLLFQSLFCKLSPLPLEFGWHAEHDSRVLPTASPAPPAAPPPRHPDHSSPLHRAISNHPQPLQQLSAHRGIGPANDTPAGHDAFDETPRCDTVTYAGTVGLHLRCGDLLRAEDLFHAAPASARDPYVNAVMLDSYLKVGRIDCARSLFDGMTSKGVDGGVDQPGIRVLPCGAHQRACAFST
jgi:pentatricopeptide repeat protein